MLIRGKVVAGKGEGKKYLSKKEYIKQFEEALSFIPFSGTLNLLVEGEDQKRFHILRRKRGIKILGFEENGEKFGAVRCFVCQVNGKVRGAVVVPEKSHYKDVVEIISDRNLRKTLSLSDGDEVYISTDDD